MTNRVGGADCNCEICIKKVRMDNANLRAENERLKTMVGDLTPTAKYLRAMAKILELVARECSWWTIVKVAKICEAEGVEIKGNAERRPDEGS